MNTTQTPYWSYTADELFKELHTTKKGLNDIDVSSRQRIFGNNRLPAKGMRSLPKVFFRQFENWLVVVLIAAAVASFFMQEKIDGLIVLSIVFLSVFFGFIQEYKAEKTIQKLKEFVTNRTEVLRNGEWQDRDSLELVVGDIIKLHIGNKVPADIRLLETDDVQMNESLVTGESSPVEKTAAVIRDKHPSPFLQRNMAFSGCYVASGTAVGCVVAVGARTFIGTTAKRLEEKEIPSAFQKQIGDFSRFLMQVVVVLTLFIFGANALLHKGLFDSFFFAVALAVGITPELLPMIITVTLSQGALRMAKEKVVVKKLIAVEDFGNIDILCCDKTGTLTEGVMSVAEYHAVDKKRNDDVLRMALICSSGFSSLGKSTANPMDQALWDHYKKHSMSHVNVVGTLTDENEFDFRRRSMSVVLKTGDHLQLIVKGAPESLIQQCTKVFTEGKEGLLSQHKTESCLSAIRTYQQRGMRVLAVAYKSITKKETTKEDEKNLTLLGWVVFEDPIKKTAHETISRFRELGIQIKIISGDSDKAVLFTAQQVGLIEPDHQVITGEQLDALDDKELARTAVEHHVFARITPEQKYRIVASLNQKGSTVGFLGDGVNDAPALKAADVGIAVDSGAELAKDAADIVLMKKDLHILAQGILIGRKTFGNITKYIFNTVSANYGNMVTIALSSLFLPFIPLLPKQILLNNFASDIPLLAIASDNIDPGYVKRPKKWNIKLIQHFMLFFGILSSLFDFATILPLIFIWKVSPEFFRTAWFIESSLSEMIVTFAIRTQHSILKSRPSRTLILLSVAAGIATVIATIVTPWSTLFEFQKLPIVIYVWIGVVLCGYLISTELLKHVFFRYFEKVNE